MTLWEMLAVAVHALPEPFGRQDVLEWFALHHPEANPTSVSTHLHCATSNAKLGSRGAFEGRTPLVTRIARGEYIRFRDADSQQSPAPRSWVEDAATQPASRPIGSSSDGSYDIVLVSCGKAKRLTPSPAADLYTSDGFRKRRAIAEDAGRSWFVLSAEHGLVDPHEWLAPYDLALKDTGPGYRSAWGSWVAARLIRKTGPLRGKSVLVLAPAPYADAIRSQLAAAGARVDEPLAGLRQGLQGAWLTEEVACRNLILPEAGATAASSGNRAPSAGASAIASALIGFRADNKQLHESRLGYTDTAEADELLQVDPFAFLLGVVFDEGVKAERAWGAPFELKRRLGHLDPWQLRHQLDDVRAAIAQRPALHRYTEIMAEAIVKAADRVCAEYDGNAGRIWAPGSTAEEVDRRLREFHRIGPKKAAMAVELLVTHFRDQFGIAIGELQGTNVAYDVHVRRVFLRTGLVDHDDIDAITQAARHLFPERPGYLDLPTWLIGRGWCHPNSPACSQCPLSEVCPKLTTRNVA